MVKNIPEMPDKNTIKALEKKLERCRNQNFNPDAEVYKQRQLRELNEDDEEDTNDQDVSMMSTSNFE
jgi:cyclin H